MNEDANPCGALGCAMTAEPVSVCRDHRCPHRWLRESREDRQRRDEHDRRAGALPPERMARDDREGV